MSDLSGLIGVGGDATLPTVGSSLPGYTPIGTPYTPGAAPSATAISNVPTAAQAASGSAAILGILKRAGLDASGDVTAYAQQLATLGLSAGDLQNRIDADLNDQSTVLGKVVAQKYPALIQHNQAALQRNAPQLTVGDFLSTRDQNLQVIQASGLSPYVDPQTLADSWITGFTSPAEAKARIDTAVQAVFNEPPEVRAEMQRLFGAGDSLGAATAYYLDPTNALPKIQMQLAAGEVAGAATRTGYGLLTAAEASQVAQQGVTSAQAQSGFGTLGKESQLFTPLPGEVGAPKITQDQQLAAQFGGNIADTQAIARQQRARLAVFGGGGGLGATSSGLTGLGSAAG